MKDRYMMSWFISSMANGIIGPMSSWDHKFTLLWNTNSYTMFWTPASLWGNMLSFRKIMQHLTFQAISKNI